MSSSRSRSPTHGCPGGCGSQVRRELFACRPDWFRLPHALRAAISGAWTDGDKGGHLLAMADAIEWFRRNPRQSPAPAARPPQLGLF